MFPIKATVNISTPAELARFTAFIGGDYTVAVAAAPTLGVSADEKAAVLGNAKPAVEKTVAKPASAKPTATAAAEPAAVEKKAVEVSSTTQSAAAPSASSEPFQYDTLKKLILKLLPTHGDALAEIARRHGEPHKATTFKSLPPECWAAAYADVQALETASV